MRRSPMGHAPGAVVLVAVSVVAAACSPAATDGAATSPATTERRPGVATVEVDRSGLASPTETDRPFDPDGGATSGTDPLIEVTGDPRSGLDAEVAQATGPFETDWARRTVELDGFLLGIPRVDPRDRIPPLDTPLFEPIAAATWLDEREPGALVRFEDEVRFYPLAILTRHEIVNDRFGDVPVAVTYCPLCNTALTFDRRVDGRVLRFGVSGLLRNSDLVMWDDATTTLWQQLTGEGLVGDLAGTRLDIIPSAIVSYGEALDGFPEARSLSRETGFNLGYSSNPYELYSSATTPFLFDGEPDPRFPALSRVVGVVVSGEDGTNADKAYPFRVIREVGAINDEVGGVPIAVLWGGDTADALDAGTIAAGRSIGTAVAYDRRVGDRALTFTAEGGSEDTFTDAETGSTWNLLGLAVDGPLTGEQLRTVPHRNEFWFAWAAFFPDAPVHGA